MKSLPLWIVLLFALDCGGEPAPFYGRTLWSEPMSVEGVMKASARPSNEAAGPSTEMMCGTVYWCCYRVACHNAKITNKILWTYYDFPICPKTHGKPNTREGAWMYWEPKVIEILYYANGETRSQCAIEEATCSNDPQGQGICWIWPN